MRPAPHYLLVALAAILLGVLVTSTAAQDVVWLKNGDRFTGKIVKASAKELVMKLAIGPEIKIPIKEIRTFSSDHPLSVKLDDDRVLEGQLKRVDKEGFVVTTPKGDQQVTDVARIKAVSDPAVEPDIWDAKIYAAASVNRGNSNQRSAHIDGALVGTWAKASMKLEGAWDYGDAEDELTTRRAYGQLQGNWNFIERAYLYARDRLEGDTFQDLTYRNTLGGGGGFKVVKTDAVWLDLEVGSSWVREDFTGGLSDNDYASGDGTLRFGWTITDGVVLGEEALGFVNLEETDDYRLRSKTTLDVALNSQLSITFALILQYWNEPPPDVKKEDVQYLAGLTWNFW